MPATKATFTLDDETVARLAELAERLRRPKSAIVREAILDYGERAAELTGVAGPPEPARAAPDLMRYAERGRSRGLP